MKTSYTDKNGVPIFPGDILENIDSTSPWRYFACFVSGPYDDRIEIRDFNANNIGMCDLGVGGDVVNIGHFSKHLDILSNDKLEYYFGVDIEKLKANGCEVILKATKRAED